MAVFPDFKNRKGITESHLIAERAVRDSLWDRSNLIETATCLGDHETDKERAGVSVRDCVSVCRHADGHRSAATLHTNNWGVPKVGRANPSPASC